MTEDQFLRQLLGWDGAWYLRRYRDVAAAVEAGACADPLYHYLWFGRWEGRFPSAAAEARAARGEGPACVLAGAQAALGEHAVPLDWPVKGEPAKSFLVKLTNGFFERYMSGPVVLDIGYKGGNEEAVPILPHAIGIDLDYPGYDGVHLPFADGSVDTVFASHIFEHVVDYRTVIAEWFRTLRRGGFIVCMVPHQYLYEKKRSLPSRWNGDHKRFYTPARLLREFEESLPLNHYRLRHLRDNDMGYSYDIGPERHAAGCYEIELVIEKIEPPAWDLA
jgi:SAM-dependent methyltransferase